MSSPSEKPDHDAIVIAAQLDTASDADRRDTRVRHRAQAAGLRFDAKRTQGVIRLADAIAKLSGGSLLTATVLLIVNGQVSWPVIATAASALLVFIASTIFLVRLDREAAAFDHAADLIDAALRETER